MAQSTTTAKEQPPTTTQQLASQDHPQPLPKIQQIWAWFLDQECWARTPDHHQTHHLSLIEREKKQDQEAQNPSSNPDHRRTRPAITDHAIADPLTHTITDH